MAGLGRTKASNSKKTHATTAAMLPQEPKSGLQGTWIPNFSTHVDMLQQPFAASFCLDGDFCSVVFPNTRQRVVPQKAASAHVTEKVEQVDPDVEAPETRIRMPLQSLRYREGPP